MICCQSVVSEMLSSCLEGRQLSRGRHAPRSGSGERVGPTKHNEKMLFTIRIRVKIAIEPHFEYQNSRFKIRNRKFFKPSDTTYQVE